LIITDMATDNPKTPEEELGELLEDEFAAGLEENAENYEYVPQSFNPQVPEWKFEAPDIKDLDTRTNRQLLDFSALLDTLSSLEEKKKLLWRQIYENAVSDRKNAYILFGDLYKDVHNKPNEHAIMGPILSKYMERLEKSNAQLIKLAEMIDEVAETEEEWMTDEDAMYKRILDNKDKEGKK